MAEATSPHPTSNRPTEEAAPRTSYLLVAEDLALGTGSASSSEPCSPSATCDAIDHIPSGSKVIHIAGLPIWAERCRDLKRYTPSL